MRYIIGAKWSFFEKMHFFCKIFLKSLPVQKKCVSLHRQTKTRVWYSKIGIWCNGNTTDSGPVIPGSSPGIPTRSFSIEGLFFSPKYPNVSASFRNRVLSWLFFYIRKGNKDWFFNLRSLFFVILFLFFQNRNLLLYKFYLLLQVLYLAVDARNQRVAFLWR